MKPNILILCLIFLLIACSTPEDVKNPTEIELINDQARSGCAMGMLEVLKAHVPGAELSSENMRVIRGECTGLVPKYENVDRDSKQIMKARPFEFGCGISALATLAKVKSKKYVKKLKENDTLLVEKLKRYCPVPEDKPASK